MPNGLLEQLLRLGPDGLRAGEMLTSASEQIQTPSVRAGNVIAFCTREALMSLLDIGGKRSRDVGDAAERVVEVAKRVREERTSTETLLEATQTLEAALAGPGPHARRLERAITAIARRAPARTTADLLDAYVDVLGDVNTALHSDVTLNAASALHERSVTIVGGLFGPMTERLGEIDALAAIVEPTPEDRARLAALTGDARVAEYFFSRAQGPGWLTVLSEDDLLRAPLEGPWPAFRYLNRLASSDPDVLREWLSSRPPGRGLTANQAYALLGIARNVRSGVADAVARIVESHTHDQGILHGLAAYLEALDASEHAAPGVITVLKRSLAGVAGENSPADDSYLAAGILTVAVSSARAGEEARWLRILTAKLAALTGPSQHSLQFRRLVAIDGLGLEAGAPVLQLFVVAVTQVARLAAAAGMPTAERVAVLEKLPAPLAGRVIAAHLNDTVDEDGAASVVILAGEVAERVPMPETLRLLRALTAREQAGLEEQMLQALGSPPTAEELAAVAAGEELPSSWKRAYGWLEAMPQVVKEAWAAANERVEALWGTALPEGHILPPVTSGWVSLSSPADADGLAALTPLQAAGYAAAWRPEGNAYGGPTARGLADALGKSMRESPGHWLAENPVELVRTLRQPTYISEYLKVLGEHAVELTGPVTQVVEAVELVQSGPWPVEDLGGDAFDQDHDWSRACLAGVELLGKLASVGADVTAERDRAWAVIVRAAQDRHESSGLLEDPEAKPLDHAVNRNSMASLSVAVGFAVDTAKAGVEPAELIELLDEVLDLPRPDGLHARAILARPLPFLAELAPGWNAANWERLVGDEAPDGLGPETFDLYLEWGDPDQRMLEGNRSRYEAAVPRVPEHARRHLLAALLAGIDGYDAAAVIGMLRLAGEEEVSEAAQWLAFRAFEDAEMPLGPAVEFWRLALAQRLGAEAYEGFGWLARVVRLESDEWLDLMLAAALAAKGQLGQANHVAARAGEHPDDERAVRLVTALLEADLKLWYLEDVGRVGLELLAGTDPATSDARLVLRERLLEREFFDAKDPPGRG